MKKNFKFLSTLALAGMLTTSVIGTPMYAATTEDATKTEPVGVCTSIIQGKNIVPFILANRTDRVTIRDIKDNGKNMVTFKNGAVPADNTVVCTGDTFKTLDGKEYTVVIYGDVDKDGVISVRDALAIQESRGGGAGLDNIQDIAANVLRADGSSTNIVDALHIQEYAGHATETIIDKAHTPNQEDEKSDYKYTLKVNDKNYINDVNKGNSEVIINASQPLNKTITLTAKVLNAGGSDVTSNITGLSTISIQAGLNSVKLTGIDFSNVIDGPVTIQLLDVNGEIVGSNTVTKNIVKPEADAVRTERSSEADAKMSLIAKDGVKSDIKKMYYMVVKSSVTSGVTWDTTKTEENKLTYATASDIITTGSKDITNNELENELITSELSRNNAYKVYYVLENSYGSISDTTTIDSVDILKDTLISQTKIGTINVDDNGLFSWTNPTGVSAYVVTVYRDGEVVAYYDNVTAGTTTTTYSIPDTSKAGKYKISVKSKGDATTTKDSEETSSQEFEVTALKSVENIKFEVEPDGKPKFSWTDDKNNAVDVDHYEVKLYPRNVNGTYSETSVASLDKSTTNGSEKEIEYGISDLANNTVYKVEVIAVKKSDKVKLANSKETVKEGIFKIDTPTANNITNNSVELVFSDVRINGSPATYQVKIYPASKRTDGTTDVYNKENPTVVDAEYKDGKIIVSKGLEPDKDYALQLIANVEGMQGTSAYVPVSTSLSVPEISELTVVTDETKAATNNIWVKSDGTEAIVNGGKKMLMTDNYPQEFKNVIALVSKLHNKDVISVNKDNVELKLLSEESNTTALVLNTTEKDMKLVIESNGFGKTIETASGVELKEVTLKKTNDSDVGRFDVSNLKLVNDKAIVLENDVIVTGEKKYTILPTQKEHSVTINGIKVETQKQTEIKAKANKTLDVTANTETNNLVFTNLTGNNIANKDAIINFVGTNSAKQVGTITIKTEGGSVTVSATNVDVEGAKLDVTVNTGVVNVKDEEFSNTEIKVSTKGEDGALTASDKVTVNAIAKEKAPEKLIKYFVNSGTALDLKGYSSEDEKVALKTSIETAISDTLSNAELDTIISYMSSFGIDNQGATIEIANPSLTADNTEITISFAKKVVNNLPIKNIK